MWDAARRSVLQHPFTLFLTSTGSPFVSANRIVFTAASGGHISLSDERNMGKRIGRATTFPDALPYPLRRQDGVSARLESLATRLIPAPNYVSYPRERVRFGHRQSLEAWQKRKENALRLEGHRAFFLKILPALFSFRFQSVPLSFAESPQQLPTPKRRSALMIADLIKSAYLQSCRAIQSCGNLIL